LKQNAKEVIAPEDENKGWMLEFNRPINA